MNAGFNFDPTAAPATATSGRASSAGVGSRRLRKSRRRHSLLRSPGSGCTRIPPTHRAGSVRPRGGSRSAHAAGAARGSDRRCTLGDTALFVGWGGIYPGRERFARETFGKWTAILEELKAAGEIERFETVLLGPHGGELAGFTLVFGLPEKLATLPMRDDLHRLQVRATLDHAKFSVIWAMTGDAVEREFQLFDDMVLECEREPALV